MIADTMSSFSNAASSTHCHSHSHYNHNRYQQQYQEYPRSTKICCISLHDPDKIRLINVPTSLISPLRFAIFETWDRPIQQETPLKQCGGHEFKLKGRPWSCSPKNAQHVASRQVILALRNELEAGVEEDEDNDDEGQGEVELFVVDFAEYDVIRVIEAPVAVITAIRHAIFRHWKQG
ncbi:hypothetical protein BGW39_000557 [Mortierella sp. 14UC]|nr:hypothetical protein BGW39_000557 [Mortierella sp. 14UC]